MCYVNVNLRKRKQTFCAACFLLTPYLVASSTSSLLEAILSISSISGDFGFLLCVSRHSFLCTCDRVLHTNPESCLLVQWPQLDCEAWRYFSSGRIRSCSPPSIHHIKSPGLTSLELQWVSFPIARGNSRGLFSKQSCLLTFNLTSCLDAEHNSFRKCSLPRPRCLHRHRTCSHQLD